MKVLVINCGSSSLKYQLIDSDTEAVLAKGLCERIGIEGSCITHNKAGADKQTWTSPMPDHTEAVRLVVEKLTDPEVGAVKSLSEIDAIGYCGMYLAGKADRVLDSLFAAVARNEPGEAANGETLLLEILSDLDRILESHPVWRTQRWLDFARAAASSPSEADSFELEAKKLISIWGGRSLHDYSARMWSGLIKDFYIPRLKYYFDTVIAGEEPDMAAFDNSGFPEELGLSPRQPFRSPVKAAADLVEKYKDMAGLPH